MGLMLSRTPWRRVSHNNPRPREFRVGTLAGILADVATHPKLDRRELVAELFERRVTLGVHAHPHMPWHECRSKTAPRGLQPKTMANYHRLEQPRTGASAS